MNLQKAIGTIITATQQGAEASGRMPFSIVKGIVTANDDPENLRRVKATNALSPGIDTPWLQRLMVRGVDFLVPKIGETILIVYEESNPLIGFYVGINNDVNAPLNKENAIDDFFMSIPGIINILVGNNAMITIRGNLIQVDCEDVIIDCEDLTINGNLTVNGKVKFNSNSVDINGSQVATVGAPDSRGDTLTGRGW